MKLTTATADEGQIPGSDLLLPFLHSYRNLPSAHQSLRVDRKQPRTVLETSDWHGTCRIWRQPGRSSWKQHLPRVSGTDISSWLRILCKLHIRWLNICVPDQL